MNQNNQPSVQDIFDYQGFYSPLDIMSTRQAAEAMQKLEQLQDRVSNHFGERHRFKLHLLERWLYDIVTLPEILDTIESILGPDILCWSSDIFAKPPHTESFVSMHQDTTYAGLEPHEKIVNVWLALTPSTSASGCLQAIPGTHKLGQIKHAETQNEDNLLFFGQTVELPESNEKPVDMELQPGQASLHHMAVVHGSQPNRSPLPRVGIVLRYISTSVKQKKGEDSATLVRGVDTKNHFIHEPRPCADWSDEAINAFELALARPSALG